MVSELVAPGLSKPPPWAWNRGDLPPKWQDITSGLAVLVPFQEGGGITRDLISRAPADTQVGNPAWDYGPHGLTNVFIKELSDGWKWNSRTDLAFPDEFSVVVVMRVTMSTGTSDDYTIVCNGDQDSGDNHNWMMLIGEWAPDATEVGFAHRAGSDWNNAFTGVNLVVNQWYVVGMSIQPDGRNVRFFHDGEFITLGDSGAAHSSNTGKPLTIGLRQSVITPSYGSQSNADIALVAIWDRALADWEQAEVGTDPGGLLRMADSFLAGLAAVALADRLRIDAATGELTLDTGQSQLYLEEATGVITAEAGTNKELVYDKDTGRITGQ